MDGLENPTWKLWADNFVRQGDFLWQLILPQQLLQQPRSTTML